MSDREKIRREKDLEANSVTFRRSRRKHWQTGLLVASVLAATALLFAVIGLVTGLGVVRRDGGEPCSVDVAGDPTTAVSQMQCSTTRAASSVFCKMGNLSKGNLHKCSLPCSIAEVVYT